MTAGDVTVKQAPAAILSKAVECPALLIHLADPQLCSSARPDTIRPKPKHGRHLDTF